MTFSRRERWILGVSLVCSAFFLSLYVVSGRGSVPVSQIESDSYAPLAVSLYEHGVFSLSTSTPWVLEATHVPGYPLFLAVIAAPFHSIFPALLVQALLFAFSGVLLFRLFAGVVPVRVRFIAALLYVAEPFTAFTVVQPLSEALFLFLLIGGLYLGRQAFERDRYDLWVVSAMAFGAATLTRPILIFALLALMGAVVYLYRARFIRGVKILGILAGVLFVMLGSWAYRNHEAFGVWTVSAKGPYTLYFYDAALVVQYTEHLTPTEASAQLLERVQKIFPEVRTSDDVRSPRYAPVLTQEAMTLIGAHPGLFIRLYSASLATFFFSDGYRLLVTQITGTGSLPNLTRLLISRDTGALRSYGAEHPGSLLLFCIGFLFWVSVALLGARALFVRGRDPRVTATLWSAAGAVLYFALLTGPVAQARYRVVVTPFLFMLAVEGARRVYVRAKEVRSSNLHRVTRYLELTADMSTYAKRWQYYYGELVSLLRHLVPPGASVLQVGSGTGYLLNALPNTRKVGIEMNPSLLADCERRYPTLDCREGDYWNVRLPERFSHVVFAETTDALDDLDSVFRGVREVLEPDGRLIIVSRNARWRPLFRLAHLLLPRLTRSTFPSLLSAHNLENVLAVSGFEVVESGRRMILPFSLPLVSWVVNRVFARVWPWSLFGVVQYSIARPIPTSRNVASVSVVVAARNESGNIATLVERIPQFCSEMEILLVEGNSTDTTWEEIQRVALTSRPGRRIRGIRQTGRGKWNAVQEGFQEATGELLMILDADMTVSPEDLPRFYEVYRAGYGDVVNGSRLIYPMEEGAMRFLNKLGNLFFATLVGAIVHKPLTDTLCGTKVFLRRDWERMMAVRGTLGLHDPFGDFEILCAAAWLHLKIVELPVRYADRTFGRTQIHRFRDGVLLLRLCVRAWIAFRFTSPSSRS